MRRREFVQLSMLWGLQACASTSGPVAGANTIPRRVGRIAYAEYALLIAAQSRIDLEAASPLEDAMGRLGEALGPATFSRAIADRRAGRLDANAGADILTALNRFQGADLVAGNSPFLVITPSHPFEPLQLGQVGCAFELSVSSGAELTGLVDTVSQAVAMQADRTRPRSCASWAGIVSAIPPGSIVTHFIPPSGCGH